MTGIYKIASKVHPERIYIGSARDIKSRWGQHKNLLLRGNHHSIKLQRHCNKYGFDDLVFSVLLMCEDVELIQKEQLFIDSVSPWFNICPTAGSNAGRKMSAESCAKMSRAHRGVPRPWRRGIPMSNEAKKKSSSSHTGVKQSIETIEKRAVKLRGKKPSSEVIERRRVARLGYRVSAETRKKLSIANMGKKPKNCMRPVLQFMDDGTFIKEWESATEAGLVLGIAQPNINKVLNNKRLHAGGFVWKFKDI
jgi:group I intron endonuclease